MPKPKLSTKSSEGSKSESGACLRLENMTRRKRVGREHCVADRR